MYAEAWDQRPFNPVPSLVSIRYGLLIINAIFHNQEDVSKDHFSLVPPYFGLGMPSHFH